jgi:hypothetical protein
MAPTFGRPLGGLDLSLAAQPAGAGARASRPAAWPTYRRFCSPVVRPAICYRHDRGSRVRMY